MLIGIGGNMTPRDFGFTRLKVKVARVTCKNVNIVSNHNYENYLSHSFHISNADWF